MNDTSYMSAAARRLLEDFDTSDLGPATEQTVHAHRQAARDAFLPRAERSVARHRVTVEHVTIAGQPCLDIRPEGRVSGTVLYCYGGGYITGSAEEDLIVSAALSAGAEARVIAVDYPLAPEHPFPAAHEAAWAVYSALIADGPIAIAGESAGGNLALTLMQRANTSPLAVLLLSPWCDLTGAGDSVGVNDGRDPTLGQKHLHAAAALYAGHADLADPSVSPVYGSFSEDGPPVMITTGTRDILQSQCVELARRMRIHGQDVRLDVYDGLWHVFEFYDELPEAADSLRACSAFLRSKLRG